MLEARNHGSAGDSAPADYSVPVDSSQADCSEQADSAPDDCWVALAWDDHSVRAAGIRDLAQGCWLPDGCSEPVDSAEAVPVAHLLALLPAGFRADSQLVVASQAWKAPRHSLVVQRSLQPAESSSPSVDVLRAVPDAAPALAVSPQMTAAAAVAPSSR